MSSNNNYITLSVIIPAYNEAARVGRTLKSVAEYLARRPYNSELILVDDGSSDETVAVAREHAATISGMKILRQPNNRGKGWAVRAGMLNAAGQYRLFMDADGSTAIEHWDDLKRALDAGADIAVGSRHVEGSAIEARQSLHREALGYTFRQLVRTAFGLTINDTQNGFKAFTADAAQRIFRRQQVPGWAFDVEILSIARRFNYRMVEVPIRWIDDSRSKMTFGAMPRMLTDLFRIRIGAVRVEPALRLEVPEVVTV